MGLFDRFLDAVRLNDDDYEEDEFFDEEDFDDFDDEPAQPKRRFFSRFSSSKKEIEDDFEDEPEPVAKPATKQTARTAAPKPARQVSVKPAASPKVTPMRKNRVTGNMEVCVIKPTKVEDFREIADTLLSGCTVVLNLEGIDVELAQRIIDFSSGSCYAIGGGLQKVSSYIFILTPASVEISGDIQDLLGGAIPTMRTSY